MVKIKTEYGFKRLRSVSQPPQTVPQTVSQNNLPFEIVEQILSFLPIRQARQQCILSSEFRSPTHICRRFLFGKDLSKRYSRAAIVELVDHLFLTHRGLYIDAFQIYIDPVGIQNSIHKWLEICREKSIQEMELFFTEPGYTLTADYIEQLYKLFTLKLVHCELELPPNLLSLSLAVNLKNLILWFVPLKDEKIHTLISQCRQLVTFDLLYCTELSCVEIYAREHRFFKKLRVSRCQSLEVFVVDSATVECVHYSGHVPTRIRFIQATKLNEVYLNFVPFGGREYFQASVLENLVSDIPHVKILSASALIPEALTTKIRRGVFGEASYSFMNLIELHLFMEGGLFCNPYDVLVFMKRCPLLEKLFIDIDDYTFDFGPYWEFHQKSKMKKFDLCFDRLNYIKLRGFKFIAAELQLVKILLQKTTHLDSLVLVSQKNCAVNIRRPNGRRYDQLLHSWKASPEAKIVTFDHMEDPDRDPDRPGLCHSREWLF